MKKKKFPIREVNPFAIKRLRDRYEMTQREFANIIGTSATTISQMEDGRGFKAPKLLNLCIAAKAVGALDEFIEQLQWEEGL